MSTLESQYWKFLEENHGSTLTFEEWKQKWADDMKPIFEKLENQSNEESIYCPVCSGCGEDGCCNATKCKMSPDGSYCETYLKDLKVAYYMYDWFMENVYDTLTEEQKEKSDEAYEQILDKVYGEN